MKPAPFEYVAPATLDEALAVLAEHGDAAAVIAGGQSLVPLMSLRTATPAVLVDIMRIAPLRRIARTDGWLEIGAGIRMTQAERESGCVLLARALGHVGSVPVRNRGTVCGSAAHADPAAEVPAVLLALDGQVVLRSVRGERTLRADDFFASRHATARTPDEIVTAVRLPTTPGRVAFHELTPRMGSAYGDFPTVAVAAVGDRDAQGRLTHVAIAFSGVGERAVRVRDAEELLTGAVPGPDLVDAAAETAAASVHPVADIHAGPAYRRDLVRALTRRVVKELAA